MAAHRTRDVGAYKALSVTPSDATILEVTRSLYVGVTGDLAVHTADGQTITFKNAAVGYHPLQVDQVMSTGTTASQIIALY